MEMLTKKGTITSLELLEQINIFRGQEGNRATLAHSDLLKIVRDEFEEEINEGKISCVSYKDKKGEERPMFALTTSQAKQVLVRESKFVRKAVIHYIEELEKQVGYKVPENFAEALKLAYEQQLKIEQDKPKVDYYDKVLDSPSTYTTTQIAKELEMTARQLNSILHQEGIQFKQSGQWLLKKEYQNKGYAKVRTIVLDDGRTRHNTVWTEKGREFIIDLMEDI